MAFSRIVAALVLGILAGAAGDRRTADAAKEQDLAAVRELVRQKADVNGRHGDGATALHWAAHWDHQEMADLLIRAGANVNAADDHGVTPLALASLNGSARMVAALLAAGANANTSSIAGETPLMTASHTGNAQVVKLLLAAGADIAAREAALDQTALMRAVAEDHIDIARLLIEAGADVRARSKNRFTALLFAAQQGNVEMARMLVAAGADVNESAPDGIAGDTNAARSFKPDTDAAALLVAIDSEHEALAMFLLERGADPNASGAGRTALHSAAQQTMPDLVRALLARGADPNARLTKPMPALSRLIVQQHGLEVTTIGATPFWLAASYGDVAMLRLLKEGGADANLTTADRTTPLMVAAGLDYVEGQDKYGQRRFTFDTTALEARARDAVLYCLELGADINAANDKGQTALIGAVYFRSPSHVKFMVDRGAKIDVVNTRGQTPWLITQGEYRSGSFLVDKETGSLLASLGADVTLGKDIGREFVPVPPR